MSEEIYYVVCEERYFSSTIPTQKYLTADRDKGDLFHPKKLTKECLFKDLTTTDITQAKVFNTISDAYNKAVFIAGKDRTADVYKIIKEDNCEPVHKKVQQYKWNNPNETTTK